MGTKKHAQLTLDDVLLDREIAGIFGIDDPNGILMRFIAELIKLKSEPKFVGQLAKETASSCYNEGIEQSRVGVQTSSKMLPNASRFEIHDLQRAHFAPADLSVLDDKSEVVTTLGEDFSDTATLNPTLNLVLTLLGYLRGKGITNQNTTHLVAEIGKAFAKVVYDQQQSGAAQADKVRDLLMVHGGAKAVYAAYYRKMELAKQDGHVLFLTKPWGDQGAHVLTPENRWLVTIDNLGFGHVINGDFERPPSQGKHRFPISEKDVDRYGIVDLSTGGPVGQIQALILERPWWDVLKEWLHLVEKEVDAEQIQLKKSYYVEPYNQMQPAGLRLREVENSIVLLLVGVLGSACLFAGALGDHVGLDNAILRSGFAILGVGLLAVLCLLGLKPRWYNQGFASSEALRKMSSEGPKNFGTLSLKKWFEGLRDGLVYKEKTQLPAKPPTRLTGSTVVQDETAKRTDADQPAEPGDTPAEQPSGDEIKSEDETHQRILITGDRALDPADIEPTSEASTLDTSGQQRAAG